MSFVQNQKRAITKSLNVKSQSFDTVSGTTNVVGASSPILTSGQESSLYSYNYNIWSLDFDSSLSSGSCSPPSSLSMDFSSCQSSSPSSSNSSSQPPIGPMMTATNTHMTSNPIEIGCNNQTAGKRQLPSSKAQAEVINRCIEKNIKYRCLNKSMICSFCKNNGEPEVIYQSHSLKDSIGRITCPLLRNYVCPICGESGQNAHTITYCKKFKKSKQSNILNEIN